MKLMVCVPEDWCPKVVRNQGKRAQKGSSQQPRAGKGGGKGTLVSCLLLDAVSIETQEIEKISSIKVSTGLKQASITDSGSHNSTGSELFDKCILARP